jgi:electron transport complex protein RnfB
MAKEKKTGHDSKKGSTGAADVYTRLAKRLDELPNGFPPTENGVELLILKKVFSSEEAETALRLKAFPETVDSIAERLAVSPSVMKATLDAMTKKGQIGSTVFRAQHYYFLMAFVPGIYEFQVHRIDEELALLFEHYFPTLLETLGGFAPAVGRVVPVGVSVEAAGGVRPYEDVRTLIAGAKSFYVNECICQKEQKLAGYTCDHPQPLEVCLLFSRQERAYEGFSFGGRVIMREEATKILADAEKMGLVHNIFYNTERGHVGVCNCCPHCCALFRGARELGAPHLLARSNFAARIDQETCTACGGCAEGRCPMGAIEEEKGSFRVEASRCIGCGLCTSVCPTGSIALVRRPESERNEPSENIPEWFVRRARNRGIDLKLE